MLVSPAGLCGVDTFRGMERVSFLDVNSLGTEKNERLVIVSLSFLVQIPFFSFFYHTLFFRYSFPISVLEATRRRPPSWRQRPAAADEHAEVASRRGRQGGGVRDGCGVDTFREMERVSLLHVRR